jgi:hypothetical protein
MCIQVYRNVYNVCLIQHMAYGIWHTEVWYTEVWYREGGLIGVSDI